MSLLTSEPVTVLPATSDDAVVYVRDAVRALASVEEERAKAVAAVREAVMAARVMKTPWDAIGRELGVSRQAAAERFGGDVRMQLVVAWHSIERLVFQLATEREFSGRPLDYLELLRRDGVISDGLMEGAVQLYQARSAAVHASVSELTVDDAERLTDIAIPLAGLLWSLQHGDDTTAAW